MRSDLLRIINRWEQSGQDEGGRDEDEELPDVSGEGVDEDESFEGTSYHTSTSSMTPSNHNEASPRPSSSSENIGWLRGRPARALQSRAAFLNGRPSHLLYFWEVVDAHQLLQSALQRLNNHVGATDGTSTTAISSNSRASGSSSRRHRDQQQSDLALKEASSMLLPFAESMKELADSQKHLAMQRAEDRDHDRRMEEERQRTTALSECCKRTFERRSELLDNARQYRRLNAELNPNDVNSECLSNFYVNKCRLLQEEIQALEDNND